MNAALDPALSVSDAASLPSADAACKAWVAMPVDCALLSVSAGRRFGDRRRCVWSARLDRLRGRG